MRHSSLAAAPSGSPLSKKARRYHSPSHASSFERGLQSGGVRAPCRGSARFLARLGERNESRQRRVQEPAEPNAFAGPFFADAVHAVVPVAGPHQRKPMHAERQRGVESESAVLEHGRLLVGDGRIEEAVMLTRLERLAFQERDAFIEDGPVSGGVDVMGDCIGEPRTIIRDAGSHALTRMRQPPMLDIAFDELSRRGPQQMLAGQRGPRRGERHAILQLIAETIGAAGLIESGTRPDAAAQRLIEQPAVEHDVHRPVRRLDDDRAEDFVPLAFDVRFDRVEIGGAIAGDEAPRRFLVFSFAQQENDFDCVAGRQFDRGAQSRARIEARPDCPGERRGAGERGGFGERAVSTDEFAPIAGPAGLSPAQIGEGDARAKARIPGIAGEHRAGGGVDLGRNERQRSRNATGREPIRHRL